MYMLHGDGCLSVWTTGNGNMDSPRVEAPPRIASTVAGANGVNLGTRLT